MLRDTILRVLHYLCMATATRSLIEVQLKGRSLAALVTNSRRKGQSWQAISDEVRDLTGVVVSRETLRGWFPEPRRAPAA